LNAAADRIAFIRPLERVDLERRRHCVPTRITCSANSKL
jgi:hypothetical protein